MTSESWREERQRLQKRIRRQRRELKRLNVRLKLTHDRPYGQSDASLLAYYRARTHFLIDAKRRAVWWLMKLTGKSYSDISDVLCGDKSVNE